MDKSYLVMYSHYDDYEIKGIFSTRESAQEFINWWKNSDIPFDENLRIRIQDESYADRLRIIEMVMNSKIEDVKINLRVYVGSMDIDGKYYRWDNTPLSESVHKTPNNEPKYVICRDGNRMNFVITASNEQTVYDMVNTKRLKYIEQGLLK